MENRNITSADATLTCVVEDLYPAGFKMEMFSTDAAAVMNDEQYAETRMGVDCKMVAGYVDQIKNVTVTLEPSSPTFDYMNMWLRAERAGLKKYWCTLTLNIPAMQKTLIFTNGVMKQGRIVPDVRRVLAPISYTFDFEKIQ